MGGGTSSSSVYVRILSTLLNEMDGNAVENMFILLFSVVCIYCI